MEGRIYITGSGTDPGLGHNLNDPVFSRSPSLGACMPNIRRAVKLGDYIFVISGKVTSVQQYLIGGFRVEEKISMLEAYQRFPANRLRIEDGEKIGNIIVNADGSKNKLDDHNDDKAAFKRRIENFIVGSKPIVMNSENEIEKSRRLTLPMVSKIVGKQGNRIIDVMGRHTKLSEKQTQAVIDWLQSMKD
jgi:hypothetical protein